jgi:flagellar assembly protein FliH
MSLSKAIIRRYRVVTAPEPPDDAGPSEGEAERRAPPANGLAEALLAQARAEAERIVAEAQQQAEAIRQEAEAAGRQQGFEAGFAEGRAVAEAQAAQESARLHELLNSILAERVRILSKAEAELVDLALAIARKVIGDIAANHAEAVAYIVHQAIEQLGQGGPFQVHLHPTDAERLAAFWPAAGKPDWKLVPDERIAPGGCIVVCGAGQVDARLETQLDLIQKAFRDLQGVR